MGFVELIRFAAQNLWRRRARTALTILGVIIGSVCIILMVSLGVSNYSQFEKDFLESPTLTVIEVSKSYNQGSGNTKITDAVLMNFLEIEGVDKVTPVLQFPVYLVAGQYETRYMDVIAVEPEFYDFEFKEGGSFHAESTMPQIVMGYYAQKSFLEEETEEDFWMERNDEETEITLPFKIDEQPLKLYFGSKYEFESDLNDIPKSKRYNAVISGILNKTQNEMGYSSFISLNAAKNIVQQNRKLAERFGITLGEYDNARIKAVDIDDVSEIVEKLNSMGYEAYGQGVYIKNIQKEQQRQQSQLIMIGCIALFVSAIGIANTMLTSIMERRREIGIMKVTGLALSKIHQMFLIEAAMIGFVGGLIGTVVSYLVVFFANSSTGNMHILGMYLSEGTMLTIPFWLSLVSIGIAVVIGAAAGVYPAYKAMKMSPMEAIRG